jgi:hypothetical protein
MLKYILMSAIALFAFAAMLAAAGVIIGILLLPEDDWDQELEDQEQMEYLRGWNDGQP